MIDSAAPHPSRLDPAREDFDIIMATHDDAIDQGRRTYFDPSSGLTVLTRAAHLERGNCCESGCRHCPWVTPT